MITSQRHLPQSSVVSPVTPVKPAVEKAPNEGSPLHITTAHLHYLCAAALRMHSWLSTTSKYRTESTPSFLPRISPSKDLLVPVSRASISSFFSFRRWIFVHRHLPNPPSKPEDAQRPTGMKLPSNLTELRAFPVDPPPLWRPRAKTPGHLQLPPVVDPQPIPEPYSYAPSQMNPVPTCSTSKSS